MRVLLVSANRERLPSPVVPLGLLYVAAAIREEHRVRLLDLCFQDDPLRTLAEVVSEEQPDVIGIGLRNLHDSSYGSSDALLAYYAEIARTIRATTTAKIIIGGSAVTLRPTELTRAIAPDHTVIGEGEWAFRELLASIARGEAPDRVVAGGAVRQREAPSPASNLVRDARADAPSSLDAVPPPWRELVDPRYFVEEGTDSVQAKRGCAFSCTYCDYPDLEGRKVRLRDPELVAEEIVACGRRPGVSHVFVVDSVFNVPRSHALAISTALVRRRSTVPWVCYVSPVAFDAELAVAMAAAGCVGVEVGTDSGSAEVLRRLRKPFRLDHIRRAREAARRSGIADCHTFVLGAEGETPEETMETLRFADALDPGVAVFVVFTEDREEHATRHAPRRESILALLAREARTRPRWVVPELGIRHGERLMSALRRRGLRGPAWLALAATAHRGEAERPTAEPGHPGHPGHPGVPAGVPV